MAADGREGDEAGLRRRVGSAARRRGAASGRNVAKKERRSSRTRSGSARRRASALPNSAALEHRHQLRVPAVQAPQTLPRVVLLEQLADRVLLVPLEHRLAGGELVEHHAQREDIDRGPDRPPQRLLRRHVAPGPLHRARLLLAKHPLRDAEVEDLDDAGAVEDQVRGLDVAMDQAQRPPLGVARAVGVVEPVAGLPPDLDDDLGGGRDVAPDAQRGDLGEGQPVDVLHHQVEAAGVLVEVLDLDEVLVLHHRAEAGLGDEQLLEGLGLGVVGQDPLDGDPGRDPGQALAPRLEDLRQPPLRKRPHHPVLPDSFGDSGREGRFSDGHRSRGL